MSDEQPAAPGYALFKDGRQINKAHLSRDAAIAEAYAHGAVVNLAADFPGDSAARGLLEHRYSVHEIP